MWSFSSWLGGLGAKIGGMVAGDTGARIGGSIGRGLGLIADYQTGYDFGSGKNANIVKMKGYNGGKAVIKGVTVGVKATITRLAAPIMNLFQQDRGPTVTQPHFRYVDAKDVDIVHAKVWQKECQFGSRDVYDENNNIMRFYHYGIDTDAQNKSLLLAVLQFSKATPIDSLIDLNDATLDVPRIKFDTNCPEPRV
jgi:hypothetical protein